MLPCSSGLHVPYTNQVTVLSAHMSVRLIQLDTKISCMNIARHPGRIEKDSKRLGSDF